MTNRKPKARKGTVVIGSNRGMLVLRWTHLGKRYAIYLGFPDSPTNRRVAQGKAHLIELDLLSNHFDESLDKYKPLSPQSKPLEDTRTTAGLFEDFTTHKAKSITHKTLEKYQGTAKLLTGYFKETRLVDLTVDDCEGFVAHLNKLPGNSLVKRERVQQLKSAWDWAIESELWEGKNPWTGLHKRVKMGEPKPPRPFSKLEIQAIIGCFQDTEPSYAPYVRFLFATGCRTSEAIGLQWKHVSDDCSSVWIGSTLTRGIRQGTKTKKVRTVTVPTAIQSMLKDLKTSTPRIDGDSLVFHAPQGGPICDNNFRNRAWQPVLERLGIPHRKAYTTRSTFITHALEGGISPGAVAALVGNSAKVIYESYLGSIPGQSVLPDIL